MRFKGRAILLVAVVGLVIAFCLPWKLNFLRGWAGEKVRASTGRNLVIDGDVWWRWIGGRLTVDGLRFSNPAWAGRPEMLTAQQLDVQIAYLPLLHKELHLKRLAAQQPDLWLETSPSGQHNWNLDTEQKDASSGSAVSFGSVQLDAGRLAFIDPTQKVDVKAELQTAVVDGVQKLKVQAQGRWRTLTFKGDAVGDALLRLRDNEQPYGFTVDAAVGRTTVKAQGSVVAPTKPESALVQLQMSGPSLGEWYRIAGLALPDTPPYKTEGRVRFDGKRWSYEDFKSTVGRSDLGGRLAWDPSGARPLISGLLVSTSLDLRDFGLTLGSATAPGTAALEARAKALKAKAERSKQRQRDTPERQAVARVLPQQRFDSTKWGSMDADIDFVGNSVRNIGTFPIDALSFRVQLTDRQLALSKLSLKAGGGSLTGGLTIDGRASPMKASVDAQMHNLQLETLLPQIADSKSALGSFNGQVKLSGTGDSFAQQLGSANGQAQVAMGRGEISNLLIEILDLDAFEAIEFLLRGDHDVTVRCALVDVGFQQGQMQTRTAIFDTTDTLIQATGKVDFTNEQLDLRISPSPKDMSPLTARVPIDIYGPFGAPTVFPDRTRLAVRLGSAVLLGLVNPFAAILPLIETGPGKNSDCKALMNVATKDGVHPPSIGASRSPAAAAPSGSSSRNSK